MRARYISPGYVLVRVDPAPEKTEGGVFISEEWKTLPPTGVIVDMGEPIGTEGIGVQIEPGDEVFFQRYTAIDTPYGKDIRCVKASAILAINQKGGFYV